MNSIFFFSLFFKFLTKHKSCADYDLCERCYSSTSVHAMHQFVVKRRVINKGIKWEPCVRDSRPRMARLQAAAASLRGGGSGSGGGSGGGGWSWQRHLRVAALGPGTSCERERRVGIARVGGRVRQCHTSAEEEPRHHFAPARSAASRVKRGAVLNVYNRSHLRRCL